MMSEADILNLDPDYDLRAERVIRERLRGHAQVYVAMEIRKRAALRMERAGEVWTHEGRGRDAGLLIVSRRGPPAPPRDEFIFPGDGGELA